MTRDRRAGFTLIEMMIVVVVMGLAMMIAVPRFRASSKTKARMAATMLTSDLELARAKAMAHRAQVRVVFSTATSSYTGYLDFDRDGVISESIAERDSLHAFGTRLLVNDAVFGRNGQADITDFTGAGDITFPTPRSTSTAGASPPHSAPGASCTSSWPTIRPPWPRSRSPEPAASGSGPLREAIGDEAQF